jgi:hypothetical protein
MSNLLIDFQEKIDEINKYFEFVQFLDTYVIENNQTLKTESRPDFNIDMNLEKVLRGNCYLMLYNLVEGSITESINAIFTDINQNNVLLHELTPAYKQIWLKYKFDLVKSMPKKNLDKHRNIDANLNQVLQNLDAFTVHDFTEKKKVGNVVEEEIFEGYKAYLKVIKTSEISGNLDVRVIRDELSRMYDFDVPERCDELRDVKNARNKLAHGEITFSEAGLRNTIPELIIIKDNVAEYLRVVLTNIDLFIEQKGYKIPPIPFKFNNRNIKY